MAQLYKGGLGFGLYFQPNGKNPLDARSIVENFNDLGNLATFGKAVYEGMTVTVTSEAATYMLTTNSENKGDQIYKDFTGTPEENAKKLWKKVGDGLGTLQAANYEAAQKLATEDNKGQIIYCLGDSTAKFPEGNPNAGKPMYTSGPYIVIGKEQLQKMASSSASGSIEDDLKNLQEKVSGIDTTVTGHDTAITKTIPGNIETAKQAAITASKVTVSEAGDTEAGFLKTYEIKQGDQIYKINIPKDFLVKSGAIVKGNWDEPRANFTETPDGADKAFKLVLNTKDSEQGTETNEVVYIDVKDLIKDHTAGNGIDISAANEISLKLNQETSTTDYLEVTKDGGLTVKSKLAQDIANAAASGTSVQQSLNEYKQSNDAALAGVKTTAEAVRDLVGTKPIDGTYKNTVWEEIADNEKVASEGINSLKEADATLQSNIDAAIEKASKEAAAAKTVVTGSTNILATPKSPAAKDGHVEYELTLSGVTLNSEFTPVKEESAQNKTDIVDLKAKDTALDDRITTLVSTIDSVGTEAKSANTLKLVKVAVPGETNVLEAFELHKDDKKLEGSEIIKIYKESALKNVEIVQEDDKQNKGTFLKFTYQIGEGTPTYVYFNVSELLVEAEFGKGLEVVNGVANVKIAATGEAHKYLSVDKENGIMMNGIDAAIKQVDDNWKAALAWQVIPEVI